GVYRYDPDSGYWQCFNDSLPATIITDLEINYCDGTIHAGTYGRGIWRSPLWPTPPDTITQDTEWDYAVNVGNDIYIESGVTLTIKGLVNMGKDKGIYVKPNARLIIDGGTLTNQCGKFWKGIEVWGDKTKDQYPYAHPTHQGKIELKNGAMIEHARNAISMGKSLGGWTQPSGGLVIADDAIFRNNRRSVEFLSYKINNYSRFNYCEFVVDDNFRDSAQNFTSHITLWDVKNVLFRSCIFKNEISTKIWSLNRGNGIHSIDAGYTIKGVCNTGGQAPPAGTPCPEDSLTRTVFEGFNRGIQATGTSTNNTINVKQSLFEDNVLGVSIDNLDNASLTRSIFKIGGNNESGYFNSHEGIFLHETSGYRIEENTLERSDNPLESNILGIRILEGETDNNQVYKNSLDTLTRAAISEGLNRDPNHFTNGLKFLCNTFSRMEAIDIDVQKASTPNPGKHGVNGFQGDIPLSAGNTFSHIGQTESDVRNQSDNYFWYFYSGTAEQPLDYTTGKVLAITMSSNTCPSNITNGINFPLSSGKITELNNEYLTAEIAYANLLYNYNQLINGGNTTAMLAKLQLDWSQDAWTLRDELIASSPYVTEEVLREAADEDVLPHAMLLEVCLANPDATHNSEFIDFLETQAPNPMPSYMIDMIAANSDSATSRTNMESAMSGFSNEMAFSSNMIVIDLKLDSVDEAQAIRNWQRKIETMEGQYELAESFVSNGFYDSALSVLADIPDSFDLSGAGLENAHNDMVTYVNFRKTIYNDDNILDIMDLDSLRKAELYTFAQNSTGRASAMAWNILCFGYDLCKDYPPVAIESGGSARRAKPTIDPQKFIRSQYYKLNVYPNPAGEYATFDWELVHLEGKAKLRIMDLYGREISSRLISSLEGQWIWDTRSIGNGIYLYELRDEDGEILNQGKIVIQK
ncbi:MAG: T9SS type A sorting domain-containing protein, partial [Bacteroidetes bacterium]|nr:T9SS type A sorting domain-containing protein [Bacteroidota bacterium]